MTLPIAPLPPISLARSRFAVPLLPPVMLALLAADLPRQFNQTCTLRVCQPEEPGGWPSSKLERRTCQRRRAGLRPQASSMRVVESAAAAGPRFAHANQVAGWLSAPGLHGSHCRCCAVPRRIAPDLCASAPALWAPPSPAAAAAAALAHASHVPAAPAAAAMGAPRVNWPRVWAKTQEIFISQFLLISYIIATVIALAWPVPGKAVVSVSVRSGAGSTCKLQSLPLLLCMPLLPCLSPPLLAHQLPGFGFAGRAPLPSCSQRALASAPAHPRCRHAPPAAVFGQRAQLRRHQNPQYHDW